MSDYRVDITVRNNKILRYMEQLGYENPSQFCKKTGISTTIVYEFVNLKRPAMTERGDWSPGAVRLADALACEPDDLWSDAQRYLCVEKNKKSYDLTEGQIQHMMENQPTAPDVLISHDRAEAHIKDALTSLMPREAQVVRFRFGIDGCDQLTFNEIGELMGISGARVMQIEQKAMRKLWRNLSKGKVPPIDLIDVFNEG